ncbi:unnamed protein product, partial [Brassica oleracea]
MQLMSSDSVMASRVQWRDRMHKKIVIPEMNLCLFDGYLSLAEDYHFPEIQRISSRGFGWKSLEIKWLRYRHRKDSIMETTIIPRTRILTNWYRHVPDAMGFYYTIWAKHKMPKWHINRIR